MGPSCGEGPELPEEAQVVLEEQAQIAHPVAQHREPIDAGAEGVAGVPLGINTARPEHVGVDHAAPGDLEPAAVLAYAAAFSLTEHTRHVHFCRRLGERKE